MCCESECPVQHLASAVIVMCFEVVGKRDVRSVLTFRYMNEDFGAILLDLIRGLLRKVLGLTGLPAGAAPHPGVKKA